MFFILLVLAVICKNLGVIMSRPAGVAIKQVER